MHDTRAEQLRIQVRQLNALRSRREQLNVAISNLEALAQNSLEQILRDHSQARPCRRLHVIRDNRDRPLSQVSQLSQ